MIQLLGFVAASLTASAFLPQVLKAWRTGATADLSSAMLIAQTLGVALWVGYGVLLGSAPVIVSNSITLILTSLLLVLKWRSAHRDD